MHSTFVAHLGFSVSVAPDLFNEGSLVEHVPSLFPPDLVCNPCLPCPALVTYPAAMRTFIALLFLASLLMCASCVKSRPRPDYSAPFNRMDANGDTLVSWQEFSGYIPHAEREVYDSIKGIGMFIELKEWLAFKQENGYALIPGEEERLKGG